MTRLNLGAQLTCTSGIDRYRTPSSPMHGSRSPGLGLGSLPVPLPPLQCSANHTKSSCKIAKKPLPSYFTSKMFQIALSAKQRSRFPILPLPLAAAFCKVSSYQRDKEHACKRCALDHHWPACSNTTQHAKSLGQPDSLKVAMHQASSLQHRHPVKYATAPQRPASALQVHAAHLLS